MSGWIGVDLDGTLAMYDGWNGAHHIGVPIPAMVERVKRWRAAGREVKIFTARVFFRLDDDNHMQEALAAKAHIEAYCLEHLGEVLPVTCMKDYGMIELWDDRAVQVHPNTGQRADGAIDPIEVL